MDDGPIIVFDASDDITMLVRLGVAAACGALLGLERRRRHRNPAGARTMALVTMGAALFMLLAKFAFPAESTDATRIAAHVASGIGFLGAGIMFLGKTGVKNVTTAATIWFAAGIGLAAGAGMFLLAGVGTVSALVLLFLSQLDDSREETGEDSDAPVEEPEVVPEDARDT